LLAHIAATELVASLHAWLTAHLRVLLLATWRSRRISTVSALLALEGIVVGETHCEASSDALSALSLRSAIFLLK